MKKIRQKLSLKLKPQILPVEFLHVLYSVSCTVVYVPAYFLSRREITTKSAAISCLPTSKHLLPLSFNARMPEEMVERTIRIFQSTGCCVDPKHLHSFQPVSATLSLLSSFRTNRSHECVACRGGLFSSLFGGGGDDPIVKCAACGAMAHRSCAVSSEKRHLWTQNLECPVNARHLQQQQQQEEEDENIPQQTTTTQIVAAAENDEGIVCFEEERNGAKGSVWKDEADIAPQTPLVRSGEKEQPEGNNEGNKPLHFAAQSFSSVAKALQENVLASFNKQQPPVSTRANNQSKARRRTAPYPGARRSKTKEEPGLATTADAAAVKSSSKASPAPPLAKPKETGASPTSSTPATVDAPFSSEETTAALASAAPLTPEKLPPPQQQQENPIAKFVKGKVNVATVAGGIAGGVAGLALAGPAGAYAGYMAAGAGIMAVEGAIGVATVGVVAAGIATGTVTGHQINEKMEERILTMGEEGASQKVLLVRPNIRLDPVWNQIVWEARRSAPPRGRGNARHQQQRCDSDIVMTGEDEIGTSDKVLLLVSRTLNDKTSLAGHVYRYLIESFRDRALDRKVLCATNDSIVAVSPRARRDDAHAVIKHVTACLLEERPELESSSVLTELTANAVEGLVFGQLYDSVYEEIVEETQELDVGLWRKITKFEQEYGQAKASMEGLISQQAMEALHMLPEAHSAVDKLHFIVKFLDHISEHFADSTARNVCADSLLKMVCQHMVWGENQGSCNAQIGFLEEFARDEQLLRGREGYALVTLQASLHFLNASTDLQREIFAEDLDSSEGASDGDFEGAAFVSDQASSSSHNPDGDQGSVSSGSNGYY